MKREKRIPNNRVLAIGGTTWCKAVVALAHALGGAGGGAPPRPSPQAGAARGLAVCEGR